MSEKETINPNAPAIEMRGVGVGTITDPSVTVASDVNWTVKTGEFWVVAGAQRSGKTDFLMLTGGLMPPTQGSYYFYGIQMPVFEEEQIAERLKVGVVFDSGQLFHHMTIAENISLPLRYHQELFPGEAEVRTAAILEALDLTSMADRTPASLGRGMQKRAGLARALAVHPELLLLDNPLSGVDAWHANWWLNFLGELSRGHAVMDRKPVTVVVTTDNLRPWRGDKKLFACLAHERLTVLGDWGAVEQSHDEAVRNLLHEQGEVPAESPVR